MELTSSERSAALAEYDAVMAEPAPPDRRPVGCVAALVSIIGLGLLPTIARATGVPRPAALTVAAILGIVFLGGLALYLLGGGGAYGRALSTAEDALKRLGADEPAIDDLERARLAARLLANAYVSTGPATVTSFGFREAVRGLGPHLEYVKTVERVLLAERGIYAVFTLDEGDSTDGE